MGYMELDAISDELDELEDFIVKNIGSPQALVSKAVDDLVRAGGKRIRPALTILTGRALGRTSEKLIPIAASMEIIHMATLVHDDIVDDSSLRRGIPTAQSKYGKDVAVFTGDFLFSKAFFVISQYASRENLRGFAVAIKRICEGEIEQYEQRYSLHTSLLKYLRRIRRKTGVLIALSCVAGAANSRTDKRMIRNLASYGMYFGLAFQITDDILDFIGNEGTIGKPVGNDILHGIYTLPLIYAMEHSDSKEELARLLLKRNYEKRDIMDIISIVKDSGGIEFSRNLASRYVSKGLKNIEKLKESPYKKALKELIVNVNKREY